MKTKIGGSDSITSPNEMMAWELEICAPGLKKGYSSITMISQWNIEILDIGYISGTSRLPPGQSDKASI
jgi:hypothetical protein